MAKLLKKLPGRVLVHMFKDGLNLRIPLISKRLCGLLQSELTYTHKKYLATWQERKNANGLPVELTDVECFTRCVFEAAPQLVTLSGYLQRLVQLLEKNGYATRVTDLRPFPRQEVFQPSWRHLERFTLRPKQKELLDAVVTELNGNGRGQIRYPTGAGKSFLTKLICLMFPKAKIVITTRHLDPLLDMYNGLSEVATSVGIYCSKKKSSGHRLMCYSTGSLKRALAENPDLVIVDESHEVATDNIMEVFGAFRFCRMLGMSANHYDRFDGADFELEGCLGPLIADLDYDDAVSAGLIVPIETHWRNVRLTYNPCEEMKGVTRKRHGIWRNLARNKLIARDARLFPDDQVLITVQTLEHALHLQKQLPEFSLCYSSMKEEDRTGYIRKNLLPSGFQPLSFEGRSRLKAEFESGRLRKVIATPVWKRGVNFHRLQVLIRADGGASDIDSTQIPGRLSRLCSVTGKKVGVLIDYLDQFDEKFEDAAKSRMRCYRSKKWLQILPHEDVMLQQLLREAQNQA